MLGCAQTQNYVTIKTSFFFSPRSEGLMNTAHALQDIVFTLPLRERERLRAQIEHLKTTLDEASPEPLEVGDLFTDLRGKHWSTRPVVMYTRDDSPDEYTHCTESEAASALGISLQKLQQNLRGTGIAQIKVMTDEAKRKKPNFPGMKVDYYESDYYYVTVRRESEGR
jgi:hypothetical protein